MRAFTSVDAIADAVRPGPSAPTRNPIFSASTASASVTASGVRGHRDETEVAGTQFVETTGPLVELGERHQQGMTHRDANATPVQRVGAALTEQDGVDAEAGGVAEDRADVLVIVDAFEDRHGARGLDDVRHREHLGGVARRRGRRG